MSSQSIVHLLRSVGVGTLSCLCLSNLITYAAFASEGDVLLSKAMIVSSLTAALLSGPLFAFVLFKMRDLHRFNGEMRRAAREDKMTGLLNRTAFADLFEQHKAAAVPGHSASRALLLLDIDHFKLVNDRWGHPAGDEILRQTATRLRDVASAYGVVGRLGGEEFAVLVRAPSPSAVYGFAERIRNAIGSEPMLLPDGSEVSVTTSVGGVCFTGAVDFADVYKSADELLYLAKRNGRNRTAFSQSFAGDAGGEPAVSTAKPAPIQMEVRKVEPAGMRRTGQQNQRAA